MTFVRAQSEKWIDMWLCFEMKAKTKAGIIDLHCHRHDFLDVNSSAFDLMQVVITHGEGRMKNQVSKFVFA